MYRPSDLKRAVAPWLKAGGRLRGAGLSIQPIYLVLVGLA
jgi:hypothetical protein